MATQTQTASRKLTSANVGPGDQTIAEIWQAGTAFLDYYAQNGPTTLNVIFEAQDSATTGTIQIDFGAPQSLPQGFQQFTFNQALQLTINNQSGGAKYGWIVVQ
jgi:hypothetical protein